MKEESKRILEKLINKHSVRNAINDNLTPEEIAERTAWNKNEDKILAFLKSIPQIESHLCLGGYIQDKNGIPCCHGDKVKFKFKESSFKDPFVNKYVKKYGESNIGTLMWYAKNSQFVIDIKDEIKIPLSEHAFEWFEKKIGE